ncbi:endonuclease domain-containing protein [Gracilimonas mengyeensis]|uniref:Very-short-patch-repair endonuclease n=1 Tax=Gracilimonas mengyeensis TaxID=1302730 RepID=A0A521D794_9BACT|nr:endonuclease domain-containing protein [Gracilimonas mengyeensis]SMO67577.1 Very-short-patch-repair endonuclease [Gracilimonas mengyeensis]
MPNKILPYNRKLKRLARQLRKNSTLSEVLLWEQIKDKALGVEFHRQVPILDYIVDFYCHELMMAIEIDGISHNTPEKFSEDQVRQTRIEALGVTFARVGDVDVKQNMHNVLTYLEGFVRRLEKGKS